MKKKKLGPAFAAGYILVLGMVLFITIIGNRAATTVSEASPFDRRTVVIDPGHGGIDGGATSYTGVPESKINLEIALRLDDLCHFLGIHTQMTRTEDVSVHSEGETIASKKVSDLKNRVKLINAAENPILISIHQNYFQDSRYAGPQVFYGKQGGSKDFAQLLQNAFNRTVAPQSERQIKKASGIFVLEHILCPGVLIECGFISNREEANKLLNEAYQKKLCAVIATQTSCFLGDKDAA